MNSRVDIVIDLEAPFAKHNLRRLLQQFENEKSVLQICVNKWNEWKNFKNKENARSPRAVYYPGCFSVFMDRKLIADYSPDRARRQKVVSPQVRSHQAYVDKKIRNSWETNLRTYKVRKNIKIEREGTDQMFDPASITFKCRQ